MLPRPPNDNNLALLIVVLLILAVLFTGLFYISAANAAYGFDKEPVYSNEICVSKFKGKPTSHLYNGKRYFIDCESFDLAIEFDWAYRPKNYDCFGQAGAYSTMTGKAGVCVLMARNIKEFEFAENQYSFANRLNIQLIVIKMYKE